jgi:glucose-1-phosphatase
MITWFIFDLGNTVIKLAYERVIANVVRDASVDRDELLEIFEQAGGYRDMERGAVTFIDFHQFLSDRAGYRGSARDLQAVWSNFFDGPMPGIEELLDKIRRKYRVAFLSNSNEVHADVIPKQFPALFAKDDRFVFSHRFKVAKPDPEIFRRAMELLGTKPQHAAFVDDLLENVLAARSVGLTAYQYLDTATLVKQLQDDELL